MRRTPLGLHCLRLFAILLLLSGARAQQPEKTVVGSWQTTIGPLTIILELNTDGTGSFDDEPIKYTVRGASLVVDEGGRVNTYSFALRGETLVISGGDLDRSLTFTRRGAAQESKGLGARVRQATAAAESAAAARGDDAERRSENPLVGRWVSSEATVEIKDDGTLTLNGEKFDYKVEGDALTLSADGGSMSFPFRLSGDTMNVLVGGETVVYRRVKGAGGGGVDAAAGGGGSGSRPQELLGKWCYMSNVSNSGGGRMSNRCFTLYENGTYEFYSETSSSGPVASSASQGYDRGTWTATANTITSQSPTTGTQTYTLEKRNHPKTGDPMLVLDGDAYVTYNQRAPWPE